MEIYGDIHGQQIPTPPELSLHYERFYATDRPSQKHLSLFAYSLNVHLAICYFVGQLSLDCGGQDSLIIDAPIMKHE